MRRMRATLAAACVGLFALAGTAAEPPLAKTLMTERGKLLFADDLSRPLGKEWRVAKGKWTAADGALRGAELKADMHNAVARHAVPFHDVVIQYDLKLDGARQTALS